jgi:fumarate hydratase class II
MTFPTPDASLNKKAQEFKDNRIVNPPDASLNKKATEFKDIVKVGRTHLMDATPITLGQEFGAWAFQVKMAMDRVEDALKRVYKLDQGGTAVRKIQIKLFRENLYYEFTIILIKYLLTYDDVQ